MRRYRPDVSPLERVPLYRGVHRKALEFVAANTDVVRVPAGRVVAEAGRWPNEYLALVDGDVVVTDEHGRQFPAPVGTCFGGCELLHDHPHRATVATRTDATFVVITAPAFRTSVREIPQVAARVERAA